MLAQYDWRENKLLRQYQEQLKKDFSKEYFKCIQEVMDEIQLFEVQKKGIDKLLSIPICPYASCF